uniref:Uncharacterized protein n=1 Tax=Anopheles funestus TaxID=62324 RepID=A0A4Y0BGK3_ANOFN
MSKRPNSDITPSQSPKAPRTNDEPIAHTSNANPVSDNARNQSERSITATKHHEPVDKNKSLKKQQLISLIEVSKPNCSTHGKLYNTYLAISIILHQFNKSNNYRHETETIKTNKQRIDFIVAVEVGEAGKFDDILFYFSSPKGLFTFCIQAKHKLNAGKTTNRYAFIKKNDLCATSGNFSIPMYFSSYLKINQKLTKGEPDIQNGECIRRYVICNNDDLHKDVKRYFTEIDPAEDDSLQFCEAIGATCYKLHGEIPDLNEQLKKVYKQELNTDSEFDEKKDEFFSKFLLICNSKNQEQLRLKAMNLLPKWCAKAQLEIIINDLVGLLNNSLYSEPRYYVDFERLQKWFLENHLNQNITDLKRLSEEHLEAVLEMHRNMEVKPESLEKLKLFQFLKDCGSGIYKFSSTLDLTVSSRILLQALSLLTYETIFIDSSKYTKQQDMNDALKVLLLYLRDVNHPTIKVVTILGKHDRTSLNEMKELLGKYRQKIIVVRNITGSLLNEDISDRIVVNDLSDKASTDLYTQAERPIFGSTTALSSTVEKSDDFTFLLNVLDPCDQLRKIIDNNLNEMNYKSIKCWYVPRHIIPHEQLELYSEWSVESFEEYSSIDYDSPPCIEKALAANDEECIPPDFQDIGRGKVFIFLNDAGFGKSTYFTSLAYCLSIFDPSLYIIKFIAMEFSTDFKLLKESNVENDTRIVRLLYRYIHLALFVPSINKSDIKKTDTIREEADRCANLLTVSSGKIVLDESKANMLSMEKLIELRLFLDKFNHQKIVLILHGFDETAPWYKDVALKCFARFSHLEGIRSLLVVVVVFVYFMVHFLQ